MKLKIGDYYTSKTNPDRTLVIKDITKYQIYSYLLDKGIFAKAYLYDTKEFIDLVNKKARLDNGKKVKERLGVK